MLIKSCLDEFKDVSLRVAITAMPEEEALECEYITSNGYRSEWIGLNEWPAYQLTNLNPHLLDDIKTKAIQNQLRESDLSGTAFLSFFESVLEASGLTRSEVDLNPFFASLQTVSTLKNKSVYAFYMEDAHGLHTYFCSDQNQFEQMFSEKYIGSVTAWDNLSAGEITEILSHKECFVSLPCHIFENP